MKLNQKQGPMKMNTTRVLAMVAMVGVGGGAIGQEVAYSTFSASDDYNASSSWRVSDPGALSGPYAAFELSVPFTISTNGQLSSVDVAISRLVSSAGSTDRRTFTLAIDTSGRPGDALESWSVLPGTSPALVNLKSLSHPVLASGSNYWLTANLNPKGTATDPWHLNKANLQGKMLYRRSVGAAQVSLAGPLPAMRISVAAHGGSPASDTSTNTSPATPPPTVQDLITLLERATAMARALKP